MHAHSIQFEYVMDMEKDGIWLGIHRFITVKQDPGFECNPGPFNLLEGVQCLVRRGIEFPASLNEMFVSVAHKK